MSQSVEEIKREILLIDQALERSYESTHLLRRRKEILEIELRKMEG